MPPMAFTANFLSPFFLLSLGSLSSSHNMLHVEINFQAGFGDRPLVDMARHQL